MLKVQFVVTAAGPNQGRSIPMPGTKFMIGRDPDCQLRPASQAISKKHCAIEVRGGQVFVQDIGSTNGTVVRGEVITGEVEVKHGDALKVGPLEFRIEIADVPNKPASTVADKTPTPETLKKSLSPDSQAKLKAVMAPKVGSSTAMKPVAAAPKPTPPATKPVAAPVEDDAMAAMLLAMESEEPSGGVTDHVPEGSTIMEMPAVAADGTPKKKEKKATPSGAEMSNAANDILRRYIRRTGGGPS